MTDNERLVLTAINAQPCEMFFPFAAIMAQTDLSRAEVRGVCRSLRADGLAEFSSGLWSEDGHPVGSGYAITSEGAAAIEDATV